MKNLTLGPVFSDYQRVSGPLRFSSQTRRSSEGARDCEGFHESQIYQASQKPGDSLSHGITAFSESVLYLKRLLQGAAHSANCLSQG